MTCLSNDCHSHHYHCELEDSIVWALINSHGSYYLSLLPLFLSVCNLPKGNLICQCLKKTHWMLFHCCTHWLITVVKGSTWQIIIFICLPYHFHLLRFLCYWECKCYVNYGISIYCGCFYITAVSNAKSHLVHLLQYHIIWGNAIIAVGNYHTFWIWIPKGQSFPPGHSYAWPFTSISMRNMAFIKNHWSVHFIWSRWQLSHTDEVSALFDEWNIYGQSADRYEMMLCPRLNINHRNLLINVQWYNFVFSSILYI